jgi:hypothetical protein
MHRAIHETRRTTVDNLTEQDRLDAVENIKHSAAELRRELTIVAALDAHWLRGDESRNLGYYRTFIECSCGAGWWFGAHEGDPSAEDRWALHRAAIVRDTLASMSTSADQRSGGEG